MRSLPFLWISEQQSCDQSRWLWCNLKMLLPSVCFFFLYIGVAHLKKRKKFHHRFTHYKQNRVSGVLTSTLYTTLLFKVHIAGCETNGCPRSLPGIVKQDPVLPADKLLPPPAPRAPSAIFEDEEKSKVKDATICPLHG